MLSISPLSSDVATLRDALIGSVVLPGDDGWDDARRPGTSPSTSAPRPSRCPTTPTTCRSSPSPATSGLRVAAQGTGHNAAPLGDLSDTILVKTHAMRGVEIDAAARVARVEAGALWERRRRARRRARPRGAAGSSPDVGVVGYTLGGGLSWLARRYGLAANRVARDRARAPPTASSCRADHDHDADLFWALRGGGGNFGIVTALEFALFPLERSTPA